MPLKPIDVRRKEFRSSVRGYNADQVDDFLDIVADEFERSYSENLRMREEINSLRERLEQFEKLEDSIQSALIHAEAAANDMRESASSEAQNIRRNATREAELIIKEANERGQNILADSSSKVERAQESYEALKKAKQDFAADFRHLLKSYIAVMDNVDLVSAQEIEASLRERLDWDAITAAREAAERREAEEEDVDAPAEDEGLDVLAEDGDVDDAPTEEEDEGAPAGAVDPDQTQAMSKLTGPLAEDETELEIDEPEVEPASAEDEGEEAVAAESEAVEEVEREESPVVEEGESDSGQIPYDDATQGEDGGQRESRAGRFLRRRG